MLNVKLSVWVVFNGTSAIQPVVKFHTLERWIFLLSAAEEVMWFGSYLFLSTGLPVH